ncbi:hypothetical protein EPN96_02165 [bacterium]|nr:MAG: hypothetical protein EPN96_02165 [bacterium]
MERRVTLLVIALVVLAAAPALAIAPQKEGLSAAVGERWEDALRLLPSDEKAGRAEKYFRALALYNSGFVPEAVKLFGALSSSKGAFNGPALEKLVKYEYDRGNYGEVVKYFKASEGRKFMEPDSVFYRVGQSHFMLGQNADAKASLEKTADGNFHPYALVTLAQIAYGEGDVSKSIEIFDKAMDKLNSLPDREVRRALADDIRLRRGRIIYQASITSENVTKDQAEKLLKLAISQLSLIKEGSPHYADALRTIGWCSLEMGDKVRALASFETAMAIDPQNAHEDQWAIGRTLERNEFYEDAAEYYANARATAEEWAVTWEGASFGEVVPTPAQISLGWKFLQEEELAAVRRAVETLSNEFALSEESAVLKGARLDNVEKSLDEQKNLMDAIEAELVKMDKDLYEYLDVIQVGSLFPKEDRPRIEGLMLRQDRLVAALEWTERAIYALSSTLGWDNAPAALKARVEKMWQKLEEAGASLSDGQLEFLEGLKARVSVREKELMRILDSRKNESVSLREPQKKARELLALKREELGKTSHRIAEVKVRYEAAKAKLDELVKEMDLSMSAVARQELVEKKQKAKTRADQYALDEAQSLHLYQKELEKSGDGSQ